MQVHRIRREVGVNHDVVVEVDDKGVDACREFADILDNLSWYGASPLYSDQPGACKDRGAVEGR